MDDEKPHPKGSIGTLVAIAISNQNAIHTLIAQKVRRGEITADEFKELDRAMNRPLQRGLVPEGELTDHIREQHDSLFDGLRKQIS